MTDQDIRARFDGKHRALHITFGAKLTEDVYMQGYALMKNFIAANGPCSLIVDLSFVTEFGLSNEFVREIGGGGLAVPGATLRLAVAPQPAIYSSGRMVETLRSEGSAPIKMVRTLDEAYALVGAAAADFVAIDRGEIR